MTLETIHGKSYRVLGILSKKIEDKKYKNCIYLAKNVNFNKFFSNKDLEKLINKKELLKSLKDKNNSN